jgi:deoxyribodipyrimidine photo-lyase
MRAGLSSRAGPGNPARPVIFWFRQDLRLADNPGLTAAVETGRPVVPVFILDDGAASPWPPGGAGRWWLHHSLAALGRDLEALAGRPALGLRRGAAEAVLRGLVAGTGAAALFWNRCYEPAAIERDTHLKQCLGAEGIEIRSFAASLLHEPWTVKTAQDGPYQVFTPFYRAWSNRPPAPPLPKPARIETPAILPASLDLADFRLLPKRDWAAGFPRIWTPGEAGAMTRLDDFLGGPVAAYRRARDRPDHGGTSRLSPHLHFGEIGPRQIRAAVQLRCGPADGEPYLRQLAWREFSHHLLFHFRDLPAAPLRPAFERFPWRDDPPALAAWQQGRTGYPIVDAGMRELWTTGWMHNRVRMIAASFLVKDLLLPWQAGEAWFWDTLVDADLANNAASWQWVAGSGADAAPYFRIFNPVLQGRRFDPDGAYVRRWVPELARLPADYVQAPWEAPPEVLRQAAVELGGTYPKPIVDHAAARARALDAFTTIGRDRAGGPTGSDKAGLVDDTGDHQR